MESVFDVFFCEGAMVNLERALILLPGLVIGLTVHEAAHAITAMWLGDDTAQRAGRVSLNPLRHLSPMGTAALFILGFGWGKPVIVNIRNFRRPRFHYLLSSLAGPASNLILCGISLGVLYLRPPGLLKPGFEGIYFINAVLAVINLLPVPPLDGSKIWPCIIPGAKPVISGKWTMAWMVVLVVCLYAGIIDLILDPVFVLLYTMLPAG